MEVAIITRERENNLLNCILSIVKNSDLPKSIIIVKSKPFKNKHIFSQIRNLLVSKGIKLKYRQIDDLGISYSRNIAISMVEDNIYGFIDDDEYCSPEWINTAKNILLKHSNVMALTGYKDIYCQDNYWNLVWRELCKSAENKEGYTEFATSSNTFYRTQFIKKHHLKYDNDFKTSSEDFVFSQKVKQANGRMWYSHRVRVKHKFRTSMISIIKQWFDYGKTIYLFEYKYIVKNTINPINIKRFIFQGIRTKNKNPTLIPGLITIDLSLICGYLYSTLMILFKNNSNRIKYALV